MKEVIRVDVLLTGRFQDHALLYATECDGVRRKGKVSAASSELEAEASAVFLALKKAIETYPNAGEISLHTDLVKTLPYINSNVKPQTDTMKKFLRSLGKMRDDSGMKVTADDGISAEVAKNLRSLAFGDKAQAQESAKPASPKKQTASVSSSVKAGWGNKRIVRGGGSGTQASVPQEAPKADDWSNIPPVPELPSNLPKELEGDWLGWTKEGILVSYESAEDVANGICRPIWADGHIGDKIHEDAIWGVKKPDVHIQGGKAGTGWGQKGTVNASPFDAPKREVKTSAFDGYRTSRTPKPKWKLMAINAHGEIVSMLDSQKCPSATKQEVEHLADWWEQVEKYTVFRDGIEKGKNDFSHKLDANGKFKGFSMTAVDVDKDEMFIWKDGKQIYHGAITDDYKRSYADAHDDDCALRWTKELLEKEKAAEAQAEEQAKEQESKQMSLFDFMQPDDDPFSL